MAKLLTYYDLCTITDHKEFLGLSEDAEPGTVINTLGRNIFQSIRLSNQQHIHSGTVLDKLSNKIVYDFKTSKYVAVFATRYLRLWNKSTADINKVKKIKISKAIHDLVTVRGQDTLTIYRDGTCESLENCIETRKQEKDQKPIIRSDEQTIHNVACFTAVDDSNWLTYFAKTQNGQVEFVYFKLSQDTMTPVGHIAKLKLARTEQNASLIGFSVVDGDVQPSLLTIWSDKRIFMLPLHLDDSNGKAEAPGHFVAMLNLFKIDQPLIIAGVSKDCVAIYGANEHQEGASLVLYNTRFSVAQSKQFFKVYFNNARFWVIGQHILLAYGQTLACVSYRVSKEQLSDMIGSQRSQLSNNIVDKDCINEENELEASFEFLAETVANALPYKPQPNKQLNQIVSENIDNQFRSFYEHNVVLSLNRGDILLSDTVQTKIGTNVNDDVFAVEEILLLTAEMEKNGASEFEITEKCIPILIKADLTDELIKCLQKYTNVSDKMLAKSLKYFLNQPAGTDTPNGLNIVLLNTFNAEQMKTHLRNELNFPEVVRLLSHLYELLAGGEFQLHDNVQYGDSYSSDEQLLAWFAALIDAHYQQFILSSNSELLSTIGRWKELIDEHVRGLRDVKSLTSELYNLVGGKAMAKEKQSSKWYSVETLKLY